MARALREYKILGIKTTIPFHQRVLKNAAFLKGEYEREKEAASRATTLPVVGESLWKYYGKLQMTANNY